MSKPMWHLPQYVIWEEEIEEEQEQEEKENLTLFFFYRSRLKNWINKKDIDFEEMIVSYHVIS